MLRDRLYRGKASPQALAAMGGVAPEFPFVFQEIKKSRGPTVSRSAQQTQQVHGGGQNGYQSQQYANTSSASYGYATQGSTSATVATPSDALPAGWIELQDPSSGRSYYANQTTGEVTWDRPQAQPAAQPVPSQPVAHQQAPEPQPKPAVSSTPSRPAKLASKYGDGFVTSSSHPELAYQYGNVGTR